MSTSENQIPRTSDQLPRTDAKLSARVRISAVHLFGITLWNGNTLLFSSRLLQRKHWDL